MAHSICKIVQLSNYSTLTLNVTHTCSTLTVSNKLHSMMTVIYIKNMAHAHTNTEQERERVFTLQ